MGRLDDAAKRKVVELREAGLSFRKIKAVLELENIKVSAQAIYLFLKEFHGRTQPKDSAPGSSGPTAASGLALAREVGLSEVRRSGWNEQQLRSLLREASRITSYPSPTDASGKSGTPQESRGQSSGMGKAGPEQQVGDGKDEDVRIVSVTSLVQNAQHEAVNTVRSGIGTGAMATAFARKRYTPSPANPVLVARKRLLDKALFHRARVRDSGPQSGPQPVSVLRNQSCFTGADGRKVMLPQAASFDLTTTRPPHVRGLHPGANLFRRGMLHRGAMPSRSPQQQPRIGIRLPTPTQSSPTPQNPTTSIRAPAPAPAGQPSPPCQQSGGVGSGDPAVPSGLQEQVKCLASEIRSLGLALRMIVEQQGRLEREQNQQTQVQKQILSTLQEVASKMAPCNLQHPPASTVPSCPFSSAGQSVYTSCSQAQPRFGEMDGSGLENIEQFSLDALSSASINGFQPCSTSDTLTFTHTPSFTPAQSYPPDGLPYAPSHTDTFTSADNKSGDLSSTGANETFQNSVSSSQSSGRPVSPHDAQLTIIKVENV